MLMKFNILSQLDVMSPYNHQGGQQIGAIMTSEQIISEQIKHNEQQKICNMCDE